jgi:hypothetical protein
MKSYSYPKEPVGLNWQEHYEMADQLYSAYRRCAPLPTVRQLPKEERRAYDRTQKRNWAGRRKALGGKRVA